MGMEEHLDYNLRSYPIGNLNHSYTTTQG